MAIKIDKFRGDLTPPGNNVFTTGENFQVLESSDKETEIFGTESNYYSGPKI